MGTLAALTLDVEDMLYGLSGFEHPAEIALQTAVADANDVEWRFDTTDLVRRGDYFEEINSDGTAGEIVYITENHPQVADVTVRRAQLQSTSSAAVSAGQVFRRNPIFPRVRIARYINEVVDSMLWPDVWLRTQRSVDLNSGRYHYPLNSADYDVETVWQVDRSTTSVGTVTFDVTGGASEDLWSSSSAHGLAVGDAVRFSAIGTLAEPYTSGTVYWVAAVPSTTTFQLSATESTTVLEGTGSDSTGTWTLERVDVFRFEPYPRDRWEVVNNINTGTYASGKMLRLKGYIDDTKTLYYLAKTKPQSSSITSLTTDLDNLVPYAACYLLLGGTRVAPTRYDPERQRLGERINAAQPMADSRFYRDEFLYRKSEAARQLAAETWPTTWIGRNRVWSR